MSGTRVGVTLPQFTGDPERLLDGVRRAEDSGLDSIWLFDHLWPLTGGKTRAMFECWSSLAFIAAATEHISIGTLVTRSSMRHPALLAKIAATVNEVAPGRLIVGIGSGDEASRAENESVGLPYYEGYERSQQLASTVSMVKAFFDRDEVESINPFIEVKGLKPSPRSAAPPPVWVGGRSRVAIEVAATLADGWNGWGGTPEGYSRTAHRVRQLASGRRVDLTWASLVVLAGSTDEAERKLRGRPAAGYLIGNADIVGERLSEFVRAGAEHIIVTFPDSWAPGNFETLAAMKPGLPSPTAEDLDNG
jgi:alkanesulfonate monooxygenase SsuD/methylene tetrahydromethanopterin reductase-like flavin-dependent oxidoreductase (luciferase family)